MNPLLPVTPPPDLPPQLAWRTVKVPPGTHTDYMKAGPGWWGTVHFNKENTKPCCEALTGGKVPCPWHGWDKRFGCYVPLFCCGPTKQVKIVVQGAKRTFETFNEFKFGELVTIIRGKGSRDTILFTKRSFGKPTHDLDRIRALGEQDIGAYLLHLWQHRELTEHFGTDWHPSVVSEGKQKRLWLLGEGGAKPAE